MDTADIRAFAGRDWAGLEDQKARFWVERKRAMSAAVVLEVGDELRRHALAIKADWPAPFERAADLAVHCRVAEALGACSHLRTR